MWRPEMIRCVLAANWIVAGLACAMVIYGHDRAWWSWSVGQARAEMIADGSDDPRGTAPIAERYRRAEVILARADGVKRHGYYGWVLTMFGGTVTAICLMIAFPNPPGGIGRHAASGDRQPP